jgi:hypothetical protein
MTDNHDLHVEVQGDYIIITLPGTKFMVTYCKRDNPPELRAKSDWTDDFDAPVILGGFEYGHGSGSEMSAFTPDSGHSSVQVGCPLSAKSGPSSNLCLI